jgi:hypothetical protein
LRAGEELLGDSTQFGSEAAGFEYAILNAMLNGNGFAVDTNATSGPNKLLSFKLNGLSLEDGPPSPPPPLLLPRSMGTAGRKRRSDGRGGVQERD